MAVETEADRLSLLEDFGIQVTLNPLGSPTAITAIFDAPHIEIDLGVGAPISSVNPTLLCRASDAASVVQGTVVRVNGTNYSVFEVQPDGMGMTVLVIRK